jgi:hypothetical protein
MMCCLVTCCCDPFSFAQELDLASLPPPPPLLLLLLLCRYCVGTVNAT